MFHGSRFVLFCAVTAIILLGSGILSWMLEMPATSHSGDLPPLDATGRAIAEGARHHVEALAGEIGERSVRRTENLARAERHITDSFEAIGYRVRKREFLVSNERVANLEVTIPGEVTPRHSVVVGAHYDTVPGSPGADDNASGVAALLEIGRLLREKRFARTLRLVAFTTEEAPFYRTDAMGSVRYARELVEEGETVVSMFSLEMLGFYSTEARSQSYPALLGLVYPSRGDFIGFVANLRSRSLLRRSLETFRETAAFPAQGLVAPEWVSGVSWSDHWSFWQRGVPALMITDTAFFRNPHYHSPTDTPMTLDFERLARVIWGLAHVVETEALAR